MRRLRKAELLEGVGNVKFSKMIAHNTVRYKKQDDDKIYIRFYAADIIIFHSDHIVLNSDGHKTQTVRNRINEFQNVCQIQQIDFQWFVSTPNIKAINFYDGIKISNKGRHIQV